MTIAELLAALSAVEFKSSTQVVFTLADGTDVSIDEVTLAEDIASGDDVLVLSSEDVE